ncbi:MAG: alpha/beta fold hydrolase [Hyphomicrobiaceae bacterium]|nr:alpha/beta fold hydrolase [Hyphomicrobiaceae bacterium]
MTNLVLVPGLLCTDALFRHQIDALGGRVAITVGDHRRSDTLAGIAEGLLAAAPERFALAGLSMGGYVAFEILRQAPERVERLALLDTSARADQPEQSEMRGRLVSLARRKGVRAAQMQLLPRLIAPEAQHDARLVDLIMTMAEATGVEAFARQQAAIAARPDSRPLLANISCPATVIVGSDDVLTPPAVAAEIAAGIAGSRLIEIDGAGHLSSLERPEAVTDALRSWLSGD